MKKTSEMTDGFICKGPGNQSVMVHDVVASLVINWDNRELNFVTYDVSNHLTVTVREDFGSFR